MHSPHVSVTIRLSWTLGGSWLSPRAPTRRAGAASRTALSPPARDRHETVRNATWVDAPFLVFFFFPRLFFFPFYRCIPTWRRALAPTCTPGGRERRRLNFSEHPESLFADPDDEN